MFLLSKLLTLRPLHSHWYLNQSHHDRFLTPPTSPLPLPHHVHPHNPVPEHVICRLCWWRMNAHIFWSQVSFSSDHSLEVMSLGLGVHADITAARWEIKPAKKKETKTMQVSNFSNVSWGRIRHVCSNFAYKNTLKVKGSSLPPVVTEGNTQQLLSTMIYYKLTHGYYLYCITPLLPLLYILLLLL